MKIAIQSRFSELRWSRIRQLWRLFLPHVRDNRRTLLLAALAGFGAMFMRILRPWPLKVIFDLVLVPTEAASESRLLGVLAGWSSGALIAGACASLLVISLLWGLFASRQAYLTALSGQGMVFALRRQVYAHLQRLSLGFHQRRKRGDLVMRLTGDINMLRDMLADALLLGVSEGLVLISMLVVMTVMNWRLTLVALVILPLVALTTLSFSVKIREAARHQRKREGRVAAMVGEMLRSVHLIQAFGRERYQDKKFRRSNKKSLNAGLRTTRLEASMSRSVEVLLAAGTSGVLWFGVHQVKAGLLTPGDLLVFIAYLGSSYRPMRKLARVSSRMSKAVVCGERVSEVLMSAPEVSDRPDAKKARNLKGAWRLDRVKFTYPGGARALRRLSFQVAPGEFVGIVGPSGSGKSTLLALLMRLYDPRGGRIRLDGRDLRKYRVRSLREQISVVLQEPVLFGATVRENLAFGRLDADDEEIESCARLANAHEFICELSEGYDTAMAEAGASLSLGQRQRLSIARAFLRDSPILLLDEPTNSLDATTEFEIESVLRQLMRGRTTLMVAHKLSTVRDADRIVVMKRGRVLEMGTHDELMDRGGWYARNYRLQRGKERPWYKVSSDSEKAAEVVPFRVGGATG
jgi:ABC-type multidrug transport system fused ATPase/permease subunit